jgi:methyl-accepting chemotaxis protein
MAVVITGLSFMTLTYASNMSLSMSLESQHRMAAQQAEYWRARQESRLQVIRTVAHIMAGYQYIPTEMRRDIFDDILHAAMEAEPNYLQIYAVFKPNILDGRDAQYIGRLGSTPTGQYAMTWTRETGDLSARASSDIEPSMAYFNGPNNRKDRIENPIARTIAGKDTYVVRMMSPIIDSHTNEVVGGVGFLLDITPISEGVNQIMSTHEDISAMAIYSGNGFIMGSYVPERVGKTLPEVDTIYGDDTGRANQAVLNGQEFYARHYSSVLQTEVELVMYPFQIGNSDMYWAVMIGTAESYILREVYKVRMYTIIGAAAAILIAVVIIFLTLSRITQPIVTVAETLKDISEGEGDLTRTIPEKGNDEISHLSTYFNKTLEKIKKLIVLIKNEANTLHDIGDDLASHMSESAAAVNEITSNIQSLKSQAANQSASVSETNSIMEKVTFNINKLNSNIERQTDSVSMSSSAIEQMLSNIQSVTNTLAKNAKNMTELTSASDVGRSALQDVTADIQEISRESEGLWEINSVMESIASQTNLLSMNAAIEAAHAGEAGKGFAVVADEIRKLAESSSEQSKTISSVLTKMKEAIDKITFSTDNVTKNFEAIDSSVKIVADQDENIHHSMEEQNEGGKQILEAIAQLNEITRMVKDEAKEMLDSSREVIRESQNLDKITHEITGGMNEMAEGAHQINTSVNQVNEISKHNKETINLLVHEVSRFKVE